jgi:hypothetical protein
MATRRPAGRGSRHKALYINDPVQAGKYAARIKQLEDQSASLIQENQRLRMQVEEYGRIIARRERELNEHVTVTLEQASDAFKEDYRPNAPAPGTTSRRPSGSSSLRFDTTP